jgi:hypothetical protein
MRKVTPLFILDCVDVFSEQGSLQVGTTCLLEIIFSLSFSCGADFTSGALYFFFIIILWGRLLFWDLLISFGASSNCLIVSFDFLTSSSLRKVILEVNTSRCYQKHQHSLLAREVFSMMFSFGPHSPAGYAMVTQTMLLVASP